MLVGLGLARRVGRAFGIGAQVDAGQAAEWQAAPVAAPDIGAASAAEAAATAPVAMEPVGRMRALVADDSEINRMILRTFLDRLGFDVTLAATGAEAVALWEPEHVLLCLDIEMPELDGVSALLRIRDEVAARGIAAPLALAVTVNAMTQDVTDYMQAGFDGCLAKPFSRNDLVDLLRRRWDVTV